MKRSQQLKFKDPRLTGLRFFGGSNCTRRLHRVARPISTKHPIHLVLRSSKAKGSSSFLNPKNRSFVRDILSKFSKKFGIQITDFANVGNHLHLVIKIGNRRTYQPFIAAVTGGIARSVIGKKLSADDKFWDFRPFSRIVEGLRGMQILTAYMKINQLESVGMQREQIFAIRKSHPST